MDNARGLSKNLHHLIIWILLFVFPGFTACSKPADTVKNGIYMIVHSPESNKKLPAIIAIGGSEGGYSFGKNTADSFNRLGFVFIRVAYFNTENTKLPSTLEEIPLEYFENVLDSVLKIPYIDTARIGLLCISKGTEAGLHLSANRREVKALVAHVPSHVYWYGLTSWKASGNSSWTYRNYPVPFVPYGKPESGWFTKNLREYYTSGLKKYPEKEPEAIIKVENMHCALLLTSGTDDNLWPSTMMADKILQRLNSANYTYYKEHIAYQNAGHGIYRMPVTFVKYPEYLEKMGGTKEGNIKAINHNWQNTFSFFIKYLKN